MKKRIFALIITALLLLSTVSCSKKAAYDGLGEADAFESPTSTEMYSLNGYGSSDMAKEEYEKAEDINESKNDLGERKIIKNADLSFQTKEYDAFIDSLYKIIEENGGYIQSSDMNGGNIYGYNNYRYANISVRIPADKYNSFMNTVLTIGTVTHRNEYVNDVTLSYVDIESRINAYEAEYSALMELLANAESIDYIIQLRQRISEIQYELDSYKSQIRKYDDLISYSTITIGIEEVRVENKTIEKQTVGQRIKLGLEETFHDLREDLEDFSVGFIVNLPYLIIWAIVIAVIIIVISLLVKKSRKKKAKKAAAEAPAEKNNEK